MSGEAASYYDQNQRFQGQGPPPPQGYNYSNTAYTGNDVNINNNYNYNNNGYNNAQNMQEQKPPPYSPPQPGQDFNEAFKVERPKYNDIWAGLLVSIDVC